MDLYKRIVEQKEKLAVVGLGYVGLPLAVLFAEKVKVIGYDIKKDKINLYKTGIDPTNELGNEMVKSSNVQFTADVERLGEAKFYIITVPTPINSDKSPDLTLVSEASVAVGRKLTRGAVVVYESTVYPGITEDFCIPILEQESGLKCGVDFKVGYSPERINPGDQVNRLEQIVKLVAAVDEESLELISKVYELVIKAGVHRVSSIKVAEAAKVVENSQRDINIAFMNELAMVFDRMGIDTKEVISAMNTKWNALRFYPGLVGGHCIGVDPYYFIYKAEKLGYHSQLISTGRKINSEMGNYIAAVIIKQLVLAGIKVKESKVVIFGITYKEDCRDIRNSKVVDIISMLADYGINPVIIDEQADSLEVKQEYGLELSKLEEVKGADCLVFAVAHQGYRGLSVKDLEPMFRAGSNGGRVIIDVKGIFKQGEVEKAGYSYWRL